jgi:hypothetical protein
MPFILAVRPTSTLTITSVRVLRVEITTSYETITVRSTSVNVSLTK